MTEDRFQDLMDAIETIIYQYEEIENRLARIERKLDALWEDEYDDVMSPDSIPLMPYWNLRLPRA